MLFSGLLDGGLESILVRRWRGVEPLAFWCRMDDLFVGVECIVVKLAVVDLLAGTSGGHFVASVQSRIRIHELLRGWVREGGGWYGMKVSAGRSYRKCHMK